MTRELDVQKFHQVMGLPYVTWPNPLSETAVNRRIRLIEEEFDEFVEAWERDDFIQQIKELIDLLYVTYGTLVEMGIDNVQPFWEEVQLSNMSKTGGHVNEYGKWIKPENYITARLDLVFRRLYESEDE